MVELRFAALPEYSWPGGTIEGEVDLEVDKPARSRDLVLTLKGQEITQTEERESTVTGVQSGQSLNPRQQEVDFLGLSLDLHDALPYTDEGHVAPGTYRCPFTFQLPPDAPPSIASSIVPAQPSFWNARPAGAYIEYQLEARFVVPLWVDTVCRARIPVFSTRRVLGALSPMGSPPDPNHPSFVIVPDPKPLLPGSPFEGGYMVSNPTGKSLRVIELSLRRLFEYSVRGLRRSEAAPEFTCEIELGGREPTYQGRFSMPLPNNASMTGPWQGTLLRSYWVAKAVLEVELGFSHTVEAPLNPV